MTDPTKATPPSEPSSSPPLVTASTEQSTPLKQKQQNTVKVGPPAPSPATPTSATVKPPRRFLLMVFVLVIALTLLASVSFGGYQLYKQANILYRQMQHQQSQLADQVRELKSDIGDLDQQQQRLEESIKHAKRERYANQESILQAKAMAREKGISPPAWRIAEIIYLLNLANHQLILNKNPTTALAALKEADAGLQAIADPGHLKFRAQLKKEILSLATLALPNTPELLLKIDSFMALVDVLPISNRVRLVPVNAPSPADDAEPVWTQVPARLWKELKGIISIHKHEKTILPLLPPDQQWFLRQNLHLKLQALRLTVQAQQQRRYDLDVDYLNVWLRRYFDHRSPLTQQAVAVLNSLASLPLSVEPPDISASLRMLRAWLDQEQAQTNLKAQVSLVAPTPPQKP